MPNFVLDFQIHIYNMVRLYFFAALITAIALSSCSRKQEAPETIGVQTETVSESVSDGSAGYVGQIEPWSTTAVSFTGMGVVTEVLVSEGQTVAKGQRLAQMDPTQAKNTLEAAEASLFQAKDAYGRMQTLHDAAALSDKDWVDIQSKLRQAQAQVEIAKKAVADCSLTAPCSGVIGRGPMEAGTTALPSQAVCTILDISQVKCRVPVAEKEIGAIDASTPSRITIGALGGEVFTGGRIEKGVEADAITRTYDVKITIANPGRKLLPGMVADVKLATRTAVNGAAPAVTVPLRCVQQSSDGRLFVWIVSKGRAHRANVTTAQTRGNRIEITSGLAKGDKVIVLGYQKVSEDSPVEIQK